MTDAIWWKIFYKTGSRYGWLIVYAHDKDQARAVAKIQIRCSIGAGKVEILDVKKERVKKP